MKKYLAAIGYAAGYLLLFLGMQLVISFGLSLLWSVIVQVISALKHDPMFVWEAVMAGTMNLVAAASIVSGILTVIVCAAIFLIRKKSFMREIGWNRVSPESLISPFCVGFGLSVLASLLLAVFVMLLPFMQDMMAEYSAQMELLVGGSAILSGIATVLVAPVVEEVIFRGLIYTRLRRTFPQIAAMLISALVFGLVHGTVVHLIYTVPLGVIMCVFYERYRSLWASIALHVGFNLAGFVLSFMEDMPVFVLIAALAATVIGWCIFAAYRTEVTEEIWLQTVAVSAASAPAPLSYDAYCAVQQAADGMQGTEKHEGSSDAASSEPEQTTGSCK